MRRFGTWAIIAWLACSMAGCSLLYSYRNVDRYIRWSLGEYIAWDDAQETQLRARLAAQLEWHRTTQLPRYRDWLVAVDRRLDGDMDLRQMREAADQLQAFWRDTALRIEGDIAAQLALLSDEQVRDMVQVMREKQADLKSEYEDMTTSDLVKKRKREMTKTAKYWLGRLDEEQVAMIDAWARALPDGRFQWLESRERWIDAFARALQRRHDAKVFATDVRVLFVTPEQIWSPEYRARLERNRDSILQLLAELHNARSPQQRDAEHERVAHWLDHMDRMALH
jgi:hypothetical protein